jgi:hypothetical protein
LEADTDTVRRTILVLQDADDRRGLRLPLHRLRAVLQQVVPQALHEVRLPVRRLHVGALHQRRQGRASLQVKAAAAHEDRE